MKIKLDYVPSKVGYFRKIEEIFPYCPDCPKLEIHGGNLALEEVSVSSSIHT